MDVEPAAAERQCPGGCRGKLYSLKDADWCAAGTGLAWLADAPDGQGLRLRFQDEESSQVLHDRPLFSVDTYQLQGDKQSILVWEDPETQLDWALSFESPSGAKEILEAISAKAPAAEATFARPPVEARRLLPLPTLGNVADVGRLLTFVPPSQREPLALECGAAEFVEALRDAFHSAEDLDDEEALAGIFRVAKGVFLLSNQRLSEQYLGPDLFEDVMGMLEYDEGLPVEKRVAHRHVLKVQVSFRSVLPLEETADLVERIHLNFRLGYLKDIVLPRLLDDASFAALTGMIHANLSAIFVQLLERPALLQHLVDLAAQKDLQSLLFVQDLCRLAKSVPPPQRQAIHENLVERRLFDALLPLLDPRADSPQLRSIASEVLLLVAANDASGLRRYCLSERGRSSQVLGSLVRLMLSERDQGIQGQLADTVRASLDVSVMESRERDACLDALYQAGCLDALAEPLKGDFGRLRHPSACFGLQLVCDILAFAVAAHGCRAKLFMMRNGLAQQAARLMAEAPHRFLQLAPVRLLRAAIGTKDDAYNRYLVKSGAFTPLMRNFRQGLGPLGRGGNLLVSATLELLDFIRLENIEVLVAHLAQKHGAALRDLAPQCKVVEGLLLRHAQNLEREAASVADAAAAAHAARPAAANAAGAPPLCAAPAACAEAAVVADAASEGGPASGAPGAGDAGRSGAEAAAGHVDDGSQAQGAGHQLPALEAEDAVEEANTAGPGGFPAASAGPEDEDEEEEEEGAVRLARFDHYGGQSEPSEAAGGGSEAGPEADVQELVAELVPGAPCEEEGVPAPVADSQEVPCQYPAYPDEEAAPEELVSAPLCDEEEGAAAPAAPAADTGGGDARQAEGEADHLAILLLAGGGAAEDIYPKLCVEGGDKLLSHARKRQKTAAAVLN